MAASRQCAGLGCSIEFVDILDMVACVGIDFLDMTDQEQVIAIDEDAHLA